MSLTATQVEAWLTERVAEALGLPASDIDPDTPFGFYGLDSLAAVAISGELEELAGFMPPPTLLLDHPTIAAVAGFVAART